MKNKNKPLIYFLSLLLFSSCMKDDVAFNMPNAPSENQEYYSSNPKNAKNAIASVRVEEGKVVLVISENDRAFPVNWNNKIPSEPYRAIVEYVDIENNKDPKRHYIYINWLEPIETGAINRSNKSLSPDAADPIGIINDELTSVEDGFLTIHYKINTSGNIPHKFSIAPKSQETPFELVLLHESRGDAPKNTEEGIVAFPLDWLPATMEKVKLKVSYLDLDKKISTLQFEYGI